MNTIEELIQKNPVYQENIEDWEISARVMNPVLRCDIDTVLDLLLYTGGKYSTIYKLGEKGAIEIAEQMTAHGVDVDTFCQETIYKYGLSHDTTVALIKKKIVMADDLLGLTTLNLYKLFDKNYEKTLQLLKEFRRHDIFLSMSSEDKLLFEITGLTDRIKVSFKINGIYTLSDILNNEETCLSIRFMNETSKNHIREMINKYRTEIAEGLTG